MSENVQTPQTVEPGRPNVPEYSVGDIARAIRGTLESQFARVRVRGELTGCKRAASGHFYFRLKDAEAVLDAVAWRTAAPRLAVMPQDGIEVIATGRLSAYPGRSSYQLIVESLELAGEGALLKLLEERRRKLAAERLFDAARKRPLPYLPQVIGVVTSPTGAVIRDILHRLRDRFPRRVLVWPVLVQGEGAAQQVAAAIRGFDALPPEGPVPRPDVVIVARGGGSLEDLIAFNEEIVVRAAAACSIPLISAVGHETDTTLIDFAADRRAPTPTAAAEMAVPVRGELLQRLGGVEQRLLGAALRAVAERRTRIADLARALPEPRRALETLTQRVDDLADRAGIAWIGLHHRHAARVAELAGRLRHPRDEIALRTERLAGLGHRLDRAAAARVERSEQALARLASDRRMPAAAERRLLDSRMRWERVGGLLESYSYHGVLARGFALVRHGDTPVQRAGETAPAMPVTLQFADGSVEAVIGGTLPPAKPASRSKPRMPATPGGQGQLL